MREPGEVFWFNFPPPIGRHMVVVVSRPTGRDAVIVAFITTAPQPTAVDIVPLTPDRLVKGVVRCDKVMTVERDEMFWGAFVERVTDDDLQRIREGIKAAVAL